MSRIDEQLTEQFYRWELSGRGWRVFAEPVALEPPFRPFVLDNGDGSYYVGVIYHHWVADSVSIRTVLREWFVRVHDPQRASRVPARLASTGYRWDDRLHRESRS